MNDKAQISLHVRAGLSMTEHTKHISDITAEISLRGRFLLHLYFCWVILCHLPKKGSQGTDELVDGRKDRNREERRAKHYENMPIQIY